MCVWNVQDYSSADSIVAPFAVHCMVYQSELREDVIASTAGDAKSIREKLEQIHLRHGSKSSTFAPSEVVWVSGAGKIACIDPSNGSVLTCFEDDKVSSIDFFIIQFLYLEIVPFQVLNYLFSLKHIL